MQASLHHLHEPGARFVRPMDASREAPAVHTPPIPLNRPMNNLCTPASALAERGGFSQGKGCARTAFGVILGVQWHLSSDHFTPLSRAVASIDRDAYGLRFAVYDREYKAMLRRLAASKPPLSAADLTREENAFHVMPCGGWSSAPRMRRPWCRRMSRSPPTTRRRSLRCRCASLWRKSRRGRACARHEAMGRPVPPPVRDDAEAAAIEPSSERASRRPVMRRVGERMALAVVLLGLFGTALWLGSAPGGGNAKQSTTADAAPAVDDSQSVGTGGGNNNMRGGLPVLQQPSWMSPQMLYSLPMTPTAQPHGCPRRHKWRRSSRCPLCRGWARRHHAAKSRCRRAARKSKEFARDQAHDRPPKRKPADGRSCATSRRNR